MDSRLIPHDHDNVPREPSSGTQAIVAQGEENGQSLGTILSQDGLTAQQQQLVQPTTTVEHKSEPVSPIRKDLSEAYHYAIHSDQDIALEDDEMLELNIQLGEVQERNLKRKIEHKKRQTMNSSSGSGVFNLTRELSLQIDLDRAEQYNELMHKNGLLAQELAVVKANASKNHAESINQMKMELQNEAIAIKLSLQEEFRQQAAIKDRTHDMLVAEMHEELSMAKSEALLEANRVRSEAHAHTLSIVQSANAEMTQLRNATSHEWSLFMSANSNSEHAVGEILDLQRMVQDQKAISMQEIALCNSATAHLRSEFEESHLKYMMVQKQESSMEEKFYIVRDELILAKNEQAIVHAESEQTGRKVNYELELAKKQFEAIKNEYQIEVANLKAEMLQMQIKYQRARSESEENIVPILLTSKLPLKRNMQQ